MSDSDKSDREKDSLFDRASIGQMGLCVKKNKLQHMGVLGYPVPRGIVRDARAGEGGGALDYSVKSFLNQRPHLSLYPLYSVAKPFPRHIE